MKKVLILGCGWVGEAFALHMLGKGYLVYASTTSLEKATRLLGMGISSFVYDFDLEAAPKVELPASFDYVLTSIPASTRLTVDQIETRFIKLKSFLEEIPFAKQIYLSSVGVYPNTDAVYKEPYNGPFVEELRLAEALMTSIKNTVVYRLGGLFGMNRIFAKYFEGRVCTTGEELANFVHLDDVVGLITAGFEKKLESDIYNIVAPMHPTKKEVIVASAVKYNFEMPSGWDPARTFQKLVDGSKISTELNYQFHYPNPIDF